jgi:anti-anti-sigma factor
MPMRVTEEDGLTLVVLTSIFDASSAPAVRATLSAITGAVILDLSLCTFLDSSGLGVCVAALKRAKAHGWPLILSGVCGQVAQTFRDTRLDEAFVIAETAGEAARRLRAGSGTR